MSEVYAYIARQNSSKRIQTGSEPTGGSLLRTQKDYAEFRFKKISVLPIKQRQWCTRVSVCDSASHTCHAGICYSIVDNKSFATSSPLAGHDLYRYGN